MEKKILVIDDEELITKSLLKLLNTEGYNWQPGADKPIPLKKK